MKKTLFYLTLIVLLSSFSIASDQQHQYRKNDGCTTITVGRDASVDGSVMTSHTNDSREYRTWMTMVPETKHRKGAKRKIYFDSHLTASPSDLKNQKLLGEIPEVPVSYKYLNTAIPPINEHQLAMGESTFGGKKIMRSKIGLIDYYEVCRLMLQRAKTAREAIRVADELTKEYGYIDGGECFTIADTKEVWHLEIIGPGKGRKGAVWAAQRVPDGHVSVNANSARIRQIDLTQPDYFMASENVVSRAVELGLYDPKSGKPFEFCYAYADRNAMGSRRREWRVFDLLAPSLKLDPNAENYPFSVKPEKKVSVKDIMDIFRDTYENTPFDMTKFMYVPEFDNNGVPTGKFVKSPYGNPFMHYDMMPLLKVNGGWNEMGERCIARYYCTYVTVIQVRGWLPSEIGGLVWLGYDNPATTAYSPIYCGITDVAKSYKVCGRPEAKNKFNRNSAWWAFNRVADMSAQKWGDMRHDVKDVWSKYETRFFTDQKKIEEQALKLYKKNPKKARKFLTDYCIRQMNEIVKAYWQLGDDLWSKYTGKF